MTVRSDLIAEIGVAQQQMLPRQQRIVERLPVQTLQKSILFRIGVERDQAFPQRRDPLGRLRAAGGLHLPVRQRQLPAERRHHRNMLLDKCLQLGICTHTSCHFLPSYANAPGTSSHGSLPLCFVRVGELPLRAFLAALEIGARFVPQSCVSTRNGTPFAPLF